MTDPSQHRHDLGHAEVAFSGTLPDPAELAARARRYGWWYFAEYTLSAMRAWLLSVLVAAFGNPLVYLLAMGLGLGAIVSERTGTVDGVPYLVFVAPGLLISTVVMSVIGEMAYPVLGGFTWNRTFYAAHATPLEPWQIAVGHAVAVLLRFVAQSAIFYALMLLFGSSPGAWGWLSIGIGALTAGAFGTPVMAFSASRESAGDGSFVLIQRFVVMPMFLFAGTFFPLEAMPSYLHWIGWISPIWHGTQLCRLVGYGSPVPGWLAAVHLCVLVAMTGVGMWLAMRVFTRRLTS